MELTGRRNKCGWADVEDWSTTEQYRHNMTIFSRSVTHWLHKFLSVQYTHVSLEVRHVWHAPIHNTEHALTTAPYSRVYSDACLYNRGGGGSATNRHFPLDEHGGVRSGVLSFAIRWDRASYSYTGGAWQRANQPLIILRPGSVSYKKASHVETHQSVNQIRKLPREWGGGCGSQRHAAENSWVSAQGPTIPAFTSVRQMWGQWLKLRRFHV
jgi:hypothetical protein